MCGLTGILSSESQPFWEDRCRAATACLSHRGPESGAQWRNEKGTVHLGHRRLCILDLSPAAAQPLHYADRYVLIHNGELYNYLELRAQLQAQGYSFITASDTEVIAAAYAAWGAACLQRFDGAFAFALWDRQEEILFAARDRFGEKPFFFHFGSGTLRFASELKALWTLGVPRTINRRMVYNFLAIDYTSNPFDPQETFFEEVHKLPPASFLRFDARSGELSLEKYWQLYIDEQPSMTEDTAIAHLQEVLGRSVSLRLRSDVPVGLSLSGGLDSSALAALCQRSGAGAYAATAFTAAFEDYEKDEWPQAALVAQQLQLKHLRVPVAADEVTNLMAQVMRAQEEPVLSASALAQFAVYREAKRQGITVLLDGQGADEVLGGYHKYYRWYWQQLYRQRRLASSGEWKAARALGVTEPFGVAQRMAALFPDLAAALWQRRRQQQAARLPHLHPDLTGPHKRDLYHALPLQPDLNGALFFNTTVYGLEELLRLADRNSMAHGTEVRLPFLDHKLVELLFTFPASFKIRQGWTKWVLRQAVKDWLPEPIVWRRDKVGFEPPQQAWMQRPDVQEAIQEARRTLVREQVLNPDVLKQKVKPHTAHAAVKHDWKFWSLAFLFDDRL